MKKFLAFVSTANQLLIFLAVLLFIFMIGKDLISDILKPSYEKPKIKIIGNSDDVKDVVEVKYLTTFDKEILDTYIFDISSDSITIKSGPELGGSTLNMFSGGARKTYQKVNLLFVPKSGSSYLLMKNNAYITKTSYYRVSKDKDRYNKNLSKNIYLVISKDTDADGFLSRDDMADLYVSDYNGKNLNIVLKGVESYKPIKDDLIMIEVRGKSDMVFYTYDLLTKKLLKLDTKIPLTNG